MEDQIFMIEDEISDNSPPGYYVKEPYDYQRQIDKLEGQDQALQLQIHELSNQDSTLQQQIDQLYGNGDHYADRFQELQQRNDSQEEEIDRLRRQNDSLQDQISTIRKETHLELAKLSSHIKICLQNASGMSATTEPRRQNLGVGMGDGSDGSSPRSALETSPAASEHNSSFGPVSPVEYVTLQRRYSSADEKELPMLT
jgi:chaperonin cofactor prefoldin